MEQGRAQDGRYSGSVIIISAGGGEGGRIDGGGEESPEEVREEKSVIARRLVEARELRVRDSPGWEQGDEPRRWRLVRREVGEDVCII